MKLHNQSLKYLSLSILMIVSLWAVIFYLNMIREIKDSLDDGLESFKHMIIQKAQSDPSVLNKSNFDKDLFAFRKISKQQALSIKDHYIDSVILMQDANDSEPEPESVRMLTTAFETGGQFYELRVISSMVEEDELIEELIWNILWLYLALILSIIIINNILLRRLWKPFYDYLYQLKSYRLRSSGTLPAINTRTREFNDLQKAVNTFLQNSKTAFEQQKQFIENASHELQTPLAIAINKLELLLEKGDLINRQAENIAEVFKILQRLVRLNKSLLLLSKIDNKQFFENKRISLNEIFRQNMAELDEYASFKKIKMSLTQTEDLMISADVSLANIIVSNLLKNAIFHNIENGRAEINISGDRLTVCNTGKNQPLESEKIFNRFHTSGIEKTGTGLGLTIIKAIADMYGFSVKYWFKDGIHYFEIRFTGNL